MSISQALSTQSKGSTPSGSPARTAAQPSTPQRVLRGFRHPRDLEYLRVTSLKTFEQCPYTWAMRYLPEAAADEESSRAAQIGTAVHSICEDFLMQLHCPGYEAADLTAEWGLVPNEEFPKVTEYIGTLAELDVHNPLAVEERLFHRMREDAPPISGQMDFVCEVDGGRGLLILDHKTNRGYNNREWWSGQLQQLFYAWMARREWPGFERYSFRIGYPNLGTFVQWDTDPDDDAALASRFDTIWEAMVTYAAAGDWPQTVNDACQWCAVRETCAEYHATVNRFAETFQQRMGTKTPGERLRFVKDVEKIVAALRAELEAELAAKVEAAGGSLVDGGNVWTYRVEQTRRAEYGPTVEALLETAGRDPGSLRVLQAAMPDIFSVKVGGLDALIKAAPEFEKAVEAVAVKVDNPKPTLRSRPARKEVAK